jgi:hypothetical protein
MTQQLHARFFSPLQLGIPARLQPLGFARHLRNAEQLNAMLTGGYAGGPKRVGLHGAR